MKYLKFYKNFTENMVSTSGMGAVVSPQPGTLPGNTGTTGSGDISFYFKKKKSKKGNPSQVTDLRDLKQVDTEEIKDIKK
jgi:hypothetical protein